MKREQVRRIRIPSTSMISVKYLEYERTYRKKCVFPWRVCWGYVVIPYYSTLFSSLVSKIMYFLSLFSLSVSLSLSLSLYIYIYIYIYTHNSSPKRPEQLWGLNSLLFGGLFLGVKQLWHEIYHSLPSIPEVRNEQSYTSVPPLLAWHTQGQVCLF